MKKKTGRRWLALLLSGSMMLSFCEYAYATTTQEKLDKAEEEAEKTEQEIEKAEEKKSELIGAQTTLEGTLSALNTELTKVSENLSLIESNIAVKEQEIEVTRAELAAAELVRDEQNEAMQKRIQFMYESSSTTYWDMLFSATSFSELINGATYINSITTYDRGKLEEYKDIVADIEDKKATLNLEMAELARLKVDAEVERGRVNDLVNQTATEIAKYKSQISDIEDDIKSFEEYLKEQNADIEELKKQLAAEQAQSNLAANSSWRDISEITFDPGDRKLLANLIYCEARGESYEGKVAVGSVVINRVLSSVFPNTVVGVIYAPKQFAPVTSTKNSLALALAEDRASRYPDCYRAADEAMSGYSNVGNRVFFRTPIPGLEGLQIGNHIFY